MPQGSVKLAVIALALVACTQGVRSGSGSGNAAIAGAVDATSLAAMRGQGLSISVVGTQLATSMDASGKFSLAGIAPGSADLRFQAQGIDATLHVSGLEVDVDDTTRIVARRATIPLSTLKVNQIVAVNGTLKGGKVLARLVDLLLPASFDQIILRGAIDSLAAPNLVVSGLTVATDANTRFRRGMTFAGLKVGDRVAIQGALQPDGTVLASIVRDLDQ